MEDAGHARRGYFVAGLGGAQFAVPGAEERLRSFREPAQEPLTLVLAATDPANPYGATLPWPRREGDGDGRAQRAAGAQVVLTDGQLTAWLGRGEHNLHTFLPAEEPDRSRSARALAQALAALVDEGRRKALLIARVDGEEVASSPLANDLRSANFIPGIKGFLKRGASGPPGMHSRPPRGAARGPLGPDVDGPPGPAGAVSEEPDLDGDAAAAAAAEDDDA